MQGFALIPCRQRINSSSHEYRRRVLGVPERMDYEEGFEEAQT